MISARLGRSLAAWAAVSGFCLLVPTARADEAYTLAISKAHKLQILADGGATWCGQHLSLRMVVDPDSPDVGKPTTLVDMMNRLRMPISTDCKTATSADLTLIAQGKTLGIYSASAGGGWVFTAAPAPPVASAAVVAEKPVALSAPQRAEPPKAVPQAVQAPVPAGALAAASATTTPKVVQPQTTAPVTAAAPAASPQAAVAPAAPPQAPPRAPSLEVGADYPGMLVRLLRDDHALAQADGTIRWWAGYRYTREYQQLWNQEFKLRPLLDRARADLLDTMMRSDPDRVSIRISTQFDSYDFASLRFPVSLHADTIQARVPFCCVKTDIPETLSVRVDGLDAIKGLPMDKTAAQGFVERRTRYGSVDRSLVIAVTVKLDPSGFTMDKYGNRIAAGTVESAVFYGDRAGTNLLYRVSEAEISKLVAEQEAAKAAAAEALKQRQAAAAAAEQQRMAEIKRQQMIAQRAQNIRSLVNSSPSTRLANFMSSGPLNSDLHLDNLRGARGAAVFRGQSAAVTMMIQASSSGREKVLTKWPGELEVSVPATMPALNSSDWYLINGELAVPEGEGLEIAELAATKVYACTQPKCADAMDPTVIVDRKLAMDSVSQQGAQ